MDKNDVIVLATLMLTFKVARMSSEQNGIIVIAYDDIVLLDKNSGYILLGFGKLVYCNMSKMPAVSPLLTIYWFLILVCR